MLDAVQARLDATVPDLAGKVHSAADFQRLVASGQTPQHDPAAFVLPLGLQGGQAEAITGIFRQALVETVGVVLTLRDHSRTGSSVADRLREFIDEIIATLAGWSPSDATPGVFVLRSGRLLRVDRVMLAYQLDFSIDDQLRLT